MFCEAMEGIMKNNNKSSLEYLKTKASSSYGDDNNKDDDDNNSIPNFVNSNHSVIGVASRPMYLNYPSPFCQQEIMMHSSFCANVWRMLQQCNGYTHEFQLQEFHYFVVIDFEATCDKVKQPNPQEIIEFPSILVNSLTGQIEDCFQTYVRPTHHPLLTDFCKELTGIQQTQVDSGVSLSRALFMHDKWLRERGIKHTNFTIVTWTNCDCRTMLESECRLKGIYKPSYFNRWINLKVAFHKVFGRVRCNLKEAVNLAGLIWEGRAHCGLDDARNTARLLVELMRRGFRFSITDSIQYCPHTCSNGLLVLNSQNKFDRQKEKACTTN